MKKTYRSALIGVLIGLLSGPQWGYAAASGNYTDLLPIGAAANTTVISNGSGWSLTTLAPSQTFGDALSRAPMVVYQSTGTGLIQATSAVSTFTAAAVNGGSVGSTTFPASWVAVGRSIRVTVRGSYNTTGTPTWAWGLALGTTSVLTTGGLNAPTTVSTSAFTASAVLTILSTGSAGTVNASYDVFPTTAAFVAGGANLISYSTVTASPVTVDLTSQLTVNPIFTWGTSSSGNQIKTNNVLVEFLN